MGSISSILNPSSFVYEDLVSHAQQIHEQLKIAIKLLDDRLKNQKKNCEAIKSRSFTFIDPFGNQMTNKHLDHELLSTVIQKYKDKYVPKYLQKSIEIGLEKQCSISELNEEQLKTTVSKYENRTVFSTYVNIAIWILNDTIDAIDMDFIKISPSTGWYLVDTMLKKSRKCIDVQLRLFICDGVIEYDKLRWEDGTILNDKETFISHKLYEKNYVIMAKLIQEEDYTTTNDSSYQILVRTFSGKTITIQVTSKTSIKVVKRLIEAQVGVPPDYQRLIFGSKQLEDEETVSHYRMEDGCTVHLTARLRGGMYHFTSGRQNFSAMPPESAAAIDNVMKFQIYDKQYLDKMPIHELQQFILDGQTLLEILVKQTRECTPTNDLPILENILSEKLFLTSDEISDIDTDSDVSMIDNNT